MVEPIFNLWILVRESGEYVHATDPKWAKIEEAGEGRWRYGFEDLKGCPRDKPPICIEPDFDFDEPLILIERTANGLRFTLEMYDGTWHSDVYWNGSLLWKNAGGTEQNHVGEIKEVTVPWQAPVAVYGAGLIGLYASR